MGLGLGLGLRRPNPSPEAPGTQQQVRPRAGTRSRVGDCRVPRWPEPEAELARGRSFHTRLLGFFLRPALLLRLRLPLGGLFVYKQITSAPPSLPGLWARPLAALLPPPPAPNLPASQWCDLRIGWRPSSRSGYATSFPQPYKMSCTAAAALRPSELEMHLLGSSEATELEAEAAGEVRAM